MKIWPKYAFVYRAVSDEELVDIGVNGLRNKPGAYETGKLFALTLKMLPDLGKIIFFLMIYVIR